MIECCWINSVKHCCRGRGGKAVEQHRDLFYTRRKNGACYGGEFAPTHAAQRSASNGSLR